VRNAKVAEVALFGHLPEIELCLMNGIRILSFMTAEGDPEWTLFNNQVGEKRWLLVRRGLLKIEAD